MESKHPRSDHDKTIKIWNPNESEEGSFKRQRKFKQFIEEERELANSCFSIYFQTEYKESIGNLH